MFDTLGRGLAPVPDWWWAGTLVVAVGIFWLILIKCCDFAMSLQSAREVGSRIDKEKAKQDARILLGGLVALILTPMLWILFGASMIVAFIVGGYHLIKEILAWAFTRG